MPYLWRKLVSVMKYISTGVYTEEENLSCVIPLHQGGCEWGCVENGLRKYQIKPVVSFDKKLLKWINSISGGWSKCDVNR